MTYKKGQTVYTQNGNAVVFDHEHDGMGYVYPLIIVQSTTYHGDDYEEHEVEADHLLAVTMDRLYPKAPIAKLEERVAELQEQIKSSQKQADANRREVMRDLNDLVAQRDSAEKEYQVWRERHPLFDEIRMLMQGIEIFPLCADTNNYYHAPNVPYIPKQSEIHYLNLRPSGKKDTPFKWVGGVGKYRPTSRDRTIIFFKTEQERTAFIAKQFEEVCEKFRSKPDYKEDSYSTRLGYGTLKVWADRFSSFLAIPGDIEDGYKAHVQAQLDAKRQRLEDELKSLNQGDAT